MTEQVVAGLSVPPLTGDEVRVVYAAVNCLRSVTRHAAGYDAGVAEIRAEVFDVRAEVLHRFPPQDADGLFRLPALTARELAYVSAGLRVLRDGLHHLGAFGDTGPSVADVDALLHRLPSPNGQTSSPPLVASL